MGRNRKNRVTENLRAVDLNDKLFLASIGAWLVGRPLEIKLRASPHGMQVMSEAFAATKSFHDELNDPFVSLDSVMNKLHAKDKAAHEFETVFGLKWPL